MVQYVYEHERHSIYMDVTWYMLYIQLLQTQLTMIAFIQLLPPTALNTIVLHIIYNDVAHLEAYYMVTGQINSQKERGAIEGYLKNVL